MNTLFSKWTASCILFFVTLGTTQVASAVVFTFDSDDFVKTPTKSNVTTFQFTIDVDTKIIPGEVYDDPLLNIVEYSVSGALDPNTPSGFPAFRLERTIIGNEFYDQGSSLSFEVSPTANLSDGLQISELVGVNPVFVFNGQELDQTPGRYHPSLFKLNSDGSGSIRNANNVGGINPGSNKAVNVDVGDEYVTELKFLSSLTITATSAPEPSATVFLGAALIGLGSHHRRRRYAWVNQSPG